LSHNSSIWLILLTFDSNIFFILVAGEVNLAETPVSKVMTRNPIFVLFDTLAVEALQKMVLGKFRHLPIVESGEVIVLLDIAKCLYDAIARMERAAEKGKAIAVAVEGVEKQWGASIAGPNTFIETLRDRMFRPFLSTIIPENSRIATVSPTDTVLMATKKMVEYGMSSVVVAVENKTRGILTSKDILMWVIAQNLPPESTPVEKVMTPNPEYATVDTPIVDALHIMYDGKFLHLPVVDKDGVAVAVVDVLHMTHAAIATVGSNAGVSNDSSPTMMQKFWDSAMALSPDEEEDAKSSLKLASESIEITRSLPYPSSIVPNTFTFKIQDKKGRMHRFNCDTRSLTDLVTAILQRVGDEIDHNNLPHILYEDEDHDNVVLASDSDLAAAVDHARLAGWKVLKLHLDHSGTQGHRRGSQSGGVEYAQSDVWASAYSALAARAALIARLSMLAYLRRNGN
ncbi:CBS domain-containing protein CBSCBSPB5-like, partial [Camellia sinensis]|uniref:CBS domain-containing protein CBSCBSPB5-like n=1 Tax=Camellia sinensis TaxID=4442 RepID=UPI001035ABCA